MESTLYKMQLEKKWGMMNKTNLYLAGVQWVFHLLHLPFSFYF